jgi:hypothetical protein
MGRNQVEIRSGRVHLSSSIERNQISKSHELRTEISHEIGSNAASNAGVKTPIVKASIFGQKPVAKMEGNPAPASRVRVRGGSRLCDPDPDP